MRKGNAKKVKEESDKVGKKDYCKRTAQSKRKNKYQINGILFSTFNQISIFPA